MNTYLYNGHVVTASNKDEVLNPKKVVARNGEHLEKLIHEAIKKYGHKCDLNFIDISHVKDMSDVFYCSKFNGDISNWNVSNVKDMYGMFENSKFNGDISKWNVNNVKNMSYMFSKSNFNGDISKWIPMMKKNKINFKDLGLEVKDDTWSDIEV